MILTQLQKSLINYDVQYAWIGTYVELRSYSSTLKVKFRTFLENSKPICNL